MMAKYAVLNPYQTDTETLSVLWSECNNANGAISIRRISPNGLINYTYGYYTQAPVYFIRFDLNYLANYVTPESGNVLFWGGIVVSNYDNKIAGVLQYMWASSYGGSALNGVLSIAGNDYYGRVESIQYSSSNFTIDSYTGVFSNVDEMVGSDSELVSLLRSLNIHPISTSYPITYHYTNSTVSGPSEAAVGETVTVSAVPNAGYGITDATTQILVTNNDVAVPYTWDAANNSITFTMPDPS